MKPAPAIYTAANVARALGTSAATARRRLADVPPSGTTEGEGRQTARGWVFAALPAAVREKIAIRAAEYRFDSPEQLLADVANPEEFVIEINGEDEP